MSQVIPVNGDHSNLEDGGNQTRPTVISESYNITSAPGVVSLPVVIHANAGEVFRPDAMMSKTGIGLMPILTATMKEIVDSPQSTDKPEICVQPGLDQLPQQEELQSHYSPYVTVAVNPSEKEAQNDQNSPPNQDTNNQTGNENQNNCGYQRVDMPSDGSQEFIMSRDTQSSPEYADDSPHSQKPTSGAARRLRSASDTAPQSGHQKPKMYIAQYILEAFKRSSKKEMHSSEVYEAVQQIFPYYRHLDLKKKKSWMSSVRHALASSRFKKRRGPDENHKSAIRKGSLWSLNESYTPEPFARKKKHHMRKGSSRRKQKLSGRTRQDFSDMENFSNVPQRMTSVPLYPSAQMSHMQSTFAPAPMVFPSYPMMGYMPPQPPPTAVYQHPMQPQPWLPMAAPHPQPQLHAGTTQGPPCSKQNAQQMSTEVPGSVGHNMFSQQGPQMQMSGQQMQMPGQQIHMPGAQRPMQGHLQDLRAVVYENMTANNSNNSSGELPTAQQQSSTTRNIHPQPNYSTKSMLSDQAGERTNTNDSVKTAVPASSAMPSNHQVSQAVGNLPQNSTGCYPQSMVYGSLAGPQAPAKTSMNWTYAQPPAQYYQAAPQQNYNMTVSSTNNTAPELPKSIYPAMCLTTQQLQGNSDGNSSNQIAPGPFSTGGPYRAAHQQMASTSHNQYVGSFEHSNMNNAAGIKNEMSV